MDIPSISTAIVSICGGLALLTPLAKVVAAWHLSLRKTPKKSVPSERSQQASSKAIQRSRVLGRWFMVVQFSGYLFAMGLLIYLSSPWAEGRPATARDVAFTGLLVAILLQNMVAKGD